MRGGDIRRTDSSTERPSTVKCFTRCVKPEAEATVEDNSFPRRRNKRAQRNLYVDTRTKHDFSDKDACSLSEREGFTDDSD